MVACWALVLQERRIGEMPKLKSISTPNSPFFCAVNLLRCEHRNIDQTRSRRES